MSDLVRIWGSYLVRTPADFGSCSKDFSVGLVQTGEKYRIRPIFVRVMSYLYRLVRFKYQNRIEFKSI